MCVTVSMIDEAKRVPGEMASEPDFLRSKIDRRAEERGDTWREDNHIMRGKTPAAGDMLFVSNDYLDLANRAEVRDAQIEALSDNDSTVVMSAVFLHGDNAQDRFEERTAEWMGMDAALLCQSGYAANVGLIQAIGDTDKPVYIDMLAHASLWQGIQAAGMRPRPFRHNSAKHLASMIERHGPGIVVIDSVYSTNGHVAPVSEIVETAHEKGCVIIVDESHSLGTHGPKGAGMVADLGLQPYVHFVTASLAKTFAGRAGLIACSDRLREFIKYNSFPAIFSSALLPSDIAALDKTLDLIIDADLARKRLFRNTDYLRRGLQALGYQVSDGEAQIIALEAGPEHRTMALRDALEVRGVFGSVFCAPATAVNRSLIRLSINAGHTREQLDHVLEVCREIREEVDLANWPSTQRATKNADRQSKAV